MIRRLSIHSKPFIQSVLTPQNSKIRPFPSLTITAVILSSPLSVAAFSTTAPTMPAKPYAFLPKEKSGLLDLSVLYSKISEAEKKREAAFDAGRKLQAVVVIARTAVENGSESNEDELKKLVIESVGEKSDRNPREGSLASKVEEVVRLKAYVQFLEKGSLLAPSSTPYATDEEWLSGACMGLAQDLARYGLGRATARDSESVSMAKDLVQEVLEYLLQFDFRNGPLRRKYDGTKYALKTLETLLYELVVTSNDDGEKPAKMQKLEATDLLPHEELKALRERMDHRDRLRETLIKRCRDGQKAAKQAIFALHRQDPKKAKKLLDECEDMIQKDLLPIVEEEPLLKRGSFSNLLEEYAEAKLFYAWLFGDTTEVPDMTPATPPARFLKQDEFSPVVLEPTEYLGGLCDLTGEVGRFGVQRATQRDEEGVKLCLGTNRSVLSALQMMERFPKDIGKKMGQLQQSVEKLERILYEMSLSEAAGGRDVQTNSMDVEPEQKGAVDN